jgi:hypothetical protein
MKKKIVHVYDTIVVNKSTKWIVNINGEKKIVSKTTAKKYITSDTTWSIESRSCVCKDSMYNSGKPFRFYKWKGFKKRTRESLNIKLDTAPNIKLDKAPNIKLYTVSK